MDAPRVGELVALAGKYAGAARPLGAAVTVVGADPACDLRLTAPGVLPVHCVLSFTPAGLALRSMAPQATRVNGAVTAARLLADGDELAVGPLTFRVSLPEELVDLVEAPPDEVELQETALANLICARQQQFARWSAELADKREEVRQLKARIYRDTDTAQRAAADKLNQADRLVLTLKSDRARVKRLAARFAGRLKRRYAAENAELVADRKRLRAEQERFHADAHALKERLARGWELLTDGQKRLVADRQAADAQLTADRKALETQRAELSAEAAARDGNQKRVEDRVQHLLTEITRLDARAVASRAAVDRLEDQRTQLTPPAVVGPITTVVPFPDRVPLVVTPQAAATEFLGQLAVREQELCRTESALNHARRELAVQAAALHDDRLVLAEQLAVIARARQVWQATECQVVAELEAFAREVGRHEVAVAARERMVSAREDAVLLRADELDAARGKLEGWQALLNTYEAAALADRDRLLAHAEAKRADLERWEESLGGLFRNWSDEHATLTRELRTEVGRWQAERQTLATHAAAVEAERATLAATAARVAAEAVAAEEAAQSLIAAGGPQAGRRLRLLRAGWERQFRHHATAADARRQSLETATAAADERCRELARRVADAADRERAAAQAVRDAEAERLARGRQLDDRAVTLSFEEARQHATRRELDQARGEVQALARRLIGDDRPALGAA